MLDNKIVGFRQTVRQFLKSKTNQIAIIAVVGVVAGYYTDTADLKELLTVILGSIFAMTLKDAAIKDEE